MKDEIMLFKAIRALKIDVPIVAYRIIGHNIELYLYGGEVKIWDSESEKQIETTNSAIKNQRGSNKRKPYPPKKKEKDRKKEQPTPPMLIWNDPCQVLVRHSLGSWFPLAGTVEDERKRGRFDDESL